MDMEKNKNVIDNKQIKYPDPLKLNLQFFAEGDTPNDPPADPPNDPPKDKTFNQSEMDSAISKAVDTAIKNKQKDWEKEKQQAIEDAKKDAANYAKMTKQQQEEADYNKRMKAIEDRERQLNLKELTSKVEDDLKDQGLPITFSSSLVLLEDNEKIKESITGIKKTFEEAVNAAVKEKLRQDTPPGGGSGSNKADNYGKKLAQMNKKNSTNYQDAQANYFKNGGNQ